MTNDNISKPSGKSSLFCPGKELRRNLTMIMKSSNCNSENSPKFSRRINPGDHLLTLSIQARVIRRKTRTFLKGAKQRQP